MPTLTEVRALAMKLPKKSRLKLAHQLYDSSDSFADAMSDAEILAEAERRDAEIESGKVKGGTHTEMMSWLEQRTKR